MLRPGVFAQVAGWFGGTAWWRACWRATWLVGPGAGVRRARARPGAPALDVAQAGLGSLQRSTGLVRGPGRGRGELPWVSGEVVLDALAGCSPWGNGLGSLRGRSWHAVSRRPGLRLCGHGVVVAELAGGDPGIPAGAVHRQRPDPAQQRRGAGHAGLLGGSLESSSRPVSAACLAASTSQCRSTAQVARQAASRSRAGRGGRSWSGRGSCRTRCGPGTSRHA